MFHVIHFPPTLTPSKHLSKKKYEIISDKLPVVMLRGMLLQPLRPKFLDGRSLGIGLHCLDKR